MWNIGCFYGGSSIYASWTHLARLDPKGNLFFILPVGEWARSALIPLCPTQPYIPLSPHSKQTWRSRIEFTGALFHPPLKPHVPPPQQTERSPVLWGIRFRFCMSFSRLNCSTHVPSFTLPSLLQSQCPHARCIINSNLLELCFQAQIK